MEIDDPYSELGLTADASDADVKAAWRRLSARWHPDRNPSPHALHRIQRINRALGAIRDVRGQAVEESGDVADHAISLSLEDAACGCIREVQGVIAQTCTRCAGSGFAAQPVTCAQCDGNGRVRQANWFPWLATQVVCDACSGQGSTRASCAPCAGSGQAAPRRYKSRIRIPAGVRHGHVLHASVALQGRKGQQALNVRVSLLPHDFMVLEDDGTIKVEVPIDGFAWTASRWTDVPTPYGLQQMRLQRGALTYRVRGAGFPTAPSGPRADCLVTVVPLFPAEWNKRQEALIDKLVALNTGDDTSAAGARARAWGERLAAWDARQRNAD